jgi:MFS family permease
VLTQRVTELEYVAQGVQFWACDGADRGGFHSVSLSSFLPSVLSVALHFIDVHLSILLLTPYRLSVQTRFWQQMSPELGLSFEQLNNTQSAQLAGLAMGCVFFIPLTKKYGRRSTYVLSTVAMAAVSWWSTYMKTDAELYLTNLFYGLAGATNETVVQMTVSSLRAFPESRNLCEEEKETSNCLHSPSRSQTSSLYTSAARLMPSISPVSWWEAS